MRLLLTSTLSESGHKLSEIISDISQKNILCIPTAAYAEDNFDVWLESEQRDVKKFCKRYKEFDLYEKTEADLRNALQEIDIIYCTGGNTYVLLEWMKKTNFKLVLEDFFTQGGIYIGSSAGSIVMGPDIEFVGDIDDRSKSDIKDLNALGYIDFYILPHMNQPKFAQALEPEIERLKMAGKAIKFLNDDEYIWIDHY
ncbi:MAG: Type 1 glutamine amidotransferase-like domain-containing protein [Pseudomonadota bacterium]